MKQCSECKKEFQALYKARTRTHGAMCGVCWRKYQAQQESRSEGTKIRNTTVYSWDKYRSKKKIAPFSKKKLDELAKYRPLRDEYLAANNRCEAQIEGVCVGSPVDLHHRAPREFNLCNVDVFMSCCRPCHDHIHANSEWAFKKGFLLSKHGKKQE